MVNMFYSIGILYLNIYFYINCHMNLTRKLNGFIWCHLFVCIGSFQTMIWQI